MKSKTIYCRKRYSAIAHWPGGPTGEPHGLKHPLEIMVHYYSNIKKYYTNIENYYSNLIIAVILKINTIIMD